MYARFSAWADAHRDLALELVRLYLGLGLFVRGIVFLRDSSTFFELAGSADFATVGIATYVGLAHLGGGLLLAVGLATRLAALVQIPVLVGATFLVHLPESVLTANQSFAFSALVLALLCVFAVWGGGRWSLDRAVARWVTQANEEEGRIAEARLRESRSREQARRSPAAGRDAEPPATRESPPDPCVHGYERTDPQVVAERTYGPLSRLRFLTGTHPRPVEVTFRCETCGGLVEVATDTETLEAYRFRRTARS